MKKMKAVTFSYDDALTQDKRLIEIFDKYGLKATFNLNSGFLGQPGHLIREDVTVSFVHPRACEIREIYKNHEIGAHGITHPNLCELSDDEIVREIEEDRLALSAIAGYEVVGMAYPGGWVDARVARVLRERTGIRYARTIRSTHSYEPQTDLICFDPTVYHHREFDLLEKMVDEFIALEATTPKILYIWGHGFELDIRNDWARFEAVCKKLSGREDIFYGTNREVLLHDGPWGE